MKKRLKGPIWKKGMMSSPPVYHPPLELEANLTEEQKKWPVTELLVEPADQTEPPAPQGRGPNPKVPPAA
jgi:hypothetical protein